MARDTVTVPRSLFEKARNRIHVLGVLHADPRHYIANEKIYLPELDAALSSSDPEGGARGVQGSIATKQESCPETAPRTETASFLQRASDILEKHLDPDGGDIYIAHLGSRRAIQIVTALADEMASIATRSAKLIALADAIRAAQRAYMADRGNHEKGKAVAAAAAAYDAARTKSAPPFLAPHNSGERDPSVMSDSSGADTKSDGGVEVTDTQKPEIGSVEFRGKKSLEALPGSCASTADATALRSSAGVVPGPSDAQLTKTPSVDHDDGNLRDKLDIAISALEFARDGYERTDIKHIDYRVNVYTTACDALDKIALPSIPNHQPHAVSQGWQDIETAPKTRMITYHNGKTTDAIIGYCRWSVFPEDDYEAWWDYERDVEACPRFWMEVIPLPAPPSPAKTGGVE